MSSAYVLQPHGSNTLCALNGKYSSINKKARECKSLCAGLITEALVSRVVWSDQALK
jgi:hypothetical protein